MSDAAMPPATTPPRRPRWPLFAVALVLAVAVACFPALLRKGGVDLRSVVRYALLAGIVLALALGPAGRDFAERRIGRVAAWTLGAGALMTAVLALFDLAWPP